MQSESQKQTLVQTPPTHDRSAWHGGDPDVCVQAPFSAVGRAGPSTHTPAGEVGVEAVVFTSHWSAMHPVLVTGLHAVTVAGGVHAPPSPPPSPDASPCAS